MTKTQWITRTAICLALLVCVQFVTKSLNQQLITGSCVNLILAVTALADVLFPVLFVYLVTGLRTARSAAGRTPINVPE